MEFDIFKVESGLEQIAEGLKTLQGTVKKYNLEGEARAKLLRRAAQSMITNEKQSFPTKTFFTVIYSNNQERWMAIETDEMFIPNAPYFTTASEAMQAFKEYLTFTRHSKTMWKEFHDV